MKTYADCLHRGFCSSQETSNSNDFCTSSRQFTNNEIPELVSMPGSKVGYDGLTSTCS